MLIDNKYEILGTLGDEDGYLTCSMHIAKEAEKAHHIKPYPYFEAAAEDLKKGEISCLLVPGAYPKVNHFIMDSEMIVNEVFIRKIPSLVLCGTAQQSPLSTTTIYHHPATTDLLAEVEVDFDNNTPVSSNSEACRMLLQSAQASLAITNQICADFYKLVTYKVLRKEIDMPWICFTRKAEGAVAVI